jgi:hypothetical protein
MVALVVLVALGTYAWHLFDPGPMAFVGGSTVSLADYRGADPTGAPAELINADQITRGEYLARAATARSATLRPVEPLTLAAWRFRYRSGLFIRPTSQPTEKRVSAITATPIFSMRSSVAFAGTARGFTPLCRIRRTLT